MTGNAALLAYDFLHTRPSLCLTLRGSNLISGQINCLTQRFAWLEMRHTRRRNFHWSAAARVTAHPRGTVDD
jgi:hypothetical protein